MTATQNLENDHVHILDLLDVMEAMVTCKTTNTEHIKEVTDIIRGYADGFHHAKEEDLLFPEMAIKGFSKEQGPIAVMLHDHELGRNYVKGILEGLTLSKDGAIDAFQGIYKNMLGYCELLRSHIGKENNVLFRMADRLFSQDDQDSMLRQFNIIDKEERNGKTVNDYLNELTELKKIYL